MTAHHSVQTCCWGTPTLFLQWPLWYDAGQHEWSCTRRATPRVLADPAVCEECRHWAPARQPLMPLEPLSQAERCSYQRALVRNRAPDLTLL
jgi:hypothetical protein